LPKLRLEGLRVTAGVGVVPVPERATDWGLPVALSATERLALRLPPAVGLKVTLMLQLALAARVPAPTGQVVVWLKSPALVPVSPMLLMVRGAVPLLVSVTLWALLLVLTCRLPKLRLEGLKVTAGAVPVPERPTVWGLPVALSVMATLAVRLPVAEGLKVTLMLQLALAARLAGQVLVWLKSLALVPVSPMLLMLRDAVPLLVKVTIWAALVVPVS
jgi:hypothetical protein